MSKQLVDAMVHMGEQQAIDLAKRMLDEGENPLKVLELCREALEIVGKQFEAGKYFLPELILSGEMLKKISKLAKPFMRQDVEDKAVTFGMVVIGSVKGDIHDIGKDIVVFLLDVNGFDVLDLGIDVPPEKIVASIKNFQPQVVGLSGFLTLAFDSMKSTIEAISEAGLRDKVKIMIGGGQIDEEVNTYAGADAYGQDAMEAVSLAKGWIGG